MHKDIVTRFAPSPTGRLHLGHAWSAMRAHDFARSHSGRFFLRIEDIDISRCHPEHVEAVFEDLRWLGLDWDGEVMVQSQRMSAYAAAIAALEAKGLLYRCICTRSDIAAAASAPQGPMGALYPGTCRRRAVDADTALPWSWRLDTAAALAMTGPLAWEDDAKGRIAADPALLGDAILARKDAGTSYHLSVVVDDAAQGVTDVVRGRDLFAATHLHRLLQALLGLPSPRYHHHRLVVGSDGERLAKRKSAPTLAALRSSGVDPAELVENMRRARFPVGFALEEE
ncbi:tRNA glutamyl-Q(34) synthetase GluQRS [Aquisediminimonas profunda]|uniref:tRNA glutamyl-Q(34) synthetase GluQRS n=1 Tax=Aquisediminimonas profunda TaxID=1550733 RepID=UPI001C636EBC|nr:tRNA glutamyl-Q(34) synthetase GluQRS [Aquisediminimonas profunda]